MEIGGKTSYHRNLGWERKADGENGKRQQGGRWWFCSSLPLLMQLRIKCSREKRPQYGAVEIPNNSLGVQTGGCLCTLGSVLNAAGVKGCVGWRREHGRCGGCRNRWGNSRWCDGKERKMTWKSRVGLHHKIPLQYTDPNLCLAENEPKTNSKQDHLQYYSIHFSACHVCFWHMASGYWHQPEHKSVIKQGKSCVATSIKFNS